MNSFKPFLFLFFWLSGVQIVSGQSISDKFLVKPYLQYGSQTGIFVLWETSEPASTQVEFGEARFLAKKVELDQQVSLQGFRQMHEVSLAPRNAHKTL